MIRELKQKGWIISAFAKETGFDRKTVRNYINAESSPQSKPRAQRPSKLDPYKTYLLERIKEGTTNCAVLIGFGLEALTKGYHVLFMTADDLGDQCHKAAKKERCIT
ncbi:hypothetical protein [Bacillus xiapuensis]|uniref:hypothetical protein n=1 Tax=Bacillus xiapuensis TaxID=2014075 RepID=UPI0018E28A08|nr:hypothetical protein [Bacillus xiapuensis]